MSLATLSLIPFILFFLFDNYIGGVRVFDFVGFSILILLTGLRICQKKGRFNISPEAILIASLFFVFFTISFLFRQSDLKPHIGVALGLLVFLCYYGLSPIGSRWVSGIDWLLRISVASIFFQLIYTKITGHFPKLVFLNVDEVRATFAGDASSIRPTGFFMEPNNYCVPTVLLVLLRRQIQKRAFDFLAYLAIATLFMSLSLWGIFIGWGLTFYDLISRGKKVTLLFVVAITVVFFGFLNTLAETSLFKVAILKRTQNVAESVFTDTKESRDKGFGDYSEKEYMQYKDASLEGRYGGLSKGLFNVSQWDLASFFGHGISMTAFQNYAGANGLSFLLYSVGIFGVMVLLLAAWLSKVEWEVLMAILISLLSYPLVTYFLWWAWLALLLRASLAKNRPVIVKA